MKPMTWILIAIAVYVLFFMDMGTEVVMTDERQTGFIANEVKEILPDVCSYNDMTEIWGSHFISLMINN